MAEETDGVGETFDDSLRIALTIASQFGERVARLREQLARQREAAAVQEARELATRFEGERGAARASLAAVLQSAWWDQADPHAIADMHETATAWRDIDIVARDAGDVIRREVQERHGIDVDQPGADTGAVAKALAQVEHDRADAATERSQSGRELTAAQLLFAQADRHERDAQDAFERDSSSGDLDGGAERPIATEETVGHGGSDRELISQLYDSAARRQQFANTLEGKGIAQETIAARVLADGENARHPREAVSTVTGKATRVRSKAKASTQLRDRGGLSR